MLEKYLKETYEQKYIELPLFASGTPCQQPKPFQMYYSSDQYLLHKVSVKSKLETTPGIEIKKEWQNRVKKCSFQMVFNYQIDKLMRQHLKKTITSASRYDSPPISFASSLQTLFSSFQLRLINVIFYHRICSFKRKIFYKYSIKFPPIL